jgi:hypothetical protein
MIIGAVFSGIAVLISKFERKIHSLKYIPGVILFASGAAFIIKARWFSDGMEGLGYLILAILATGGCIISLMVPAAIDVYRKYHN